MGDYGVKAPMVWDAGSVLSLGWWPLSCANWEKPAPVYQYLKCCGAGEKVV